MNIFGVMIMDANDNKLMFKITASNFDAAYLKAKRYAGRNFILSIFFLTAADYLTA